MLQLVSANSAKSLDKVIYDSAKTSELHGTEPKHIWEGINAFKKRSALTGYAGFINHSVRGREQRTSVQSAQEIRQRAGREKGFENGKEPNRLDLECNTGWSGKHKTTSGKWLEVFGRPLRMLSCFAIIFSATALENVYLFAELRKHFPHRSF